MEYKQGYITERPMDYIADTFYKKEPELETFLVEELYNILNEQFEKIFGGGSRFYLDMDSKKAYFKVKI